MVNDVIYLLVSAVEARVVMSFDNNFDAELILKRIFVVKISFRLG